MTFIIRKPTSETVSVAVSKPSEGFDHADKIGARFLRDSLGEKFIKIGGEWYGI